MVKVDPDEEMINLMKFQAAYEANAKLATVLQDMISTTLNMVSR
jgi:flagellar hook-associated protein 1 FlgK